MQASVCFQLVQVTPSLFGFKTNSMYHFPGCLVGDESASQGILTAPRSHRDELEMRCRQIG